VASVSFSRRTENWIVRGQPRRGGADGELVLLNSELHEINASELKNALVSERTFYGTSRGYAAVSEVPEAYFDTEGPVTLIAFEVVEDELAITATCFASWPASGDEQEVVRRIRRLVAPLLSRSRSSLAHIASNDWMSGDQELAIDLRIVTPLRGRTAAELYRVGEDAVRLCDAFASEQVTRDTVADLVRGGSAHLLIDQPEGNWLDAKSEEYDLSTLRGKISLAQAVARFANAEDGGLIVIGARAKRIPGGEVIRQVRGVKPRHNDTDARYLKVLNERLYPPPQGLRVDLVPTEEGRALIILEVPQQPEELKPFLVHGAITADGDIEGAFISIVQRRGEGSIPITAPMIHASIATGRALLRGSGAAKSKE
jgi:hypothetical protein